MVTIYSSAYDNMLADLRSAHPDEGCGFLFGREEGDKRQILEAVPVVNAKEGDKRRRFEISPQDYMRAERYALLNDLTLLGVYHSHPDCPPIPSEQDRVAAQPFFSYVIVGVYADGRHETRSWLLNDLAQFEEEQVVFQAAARPPG